jgi:type IV secretion system protein VirB9
MKATLSTIVVLIMGVVSNGLCGVAMAAREPTPLEFDKRVREVVYNAKDVTTIIGAYGYSTQICFADDEIIEHTVVGDALAWSIDPIEGSNLLFIKPKEKDANTNMTVVTNKKRTYDFDLVAVAVEERRPYYKVTFKYPSEDQRTRDAALERTEQALRIARQEQVVLRTQLDNAVALANTLRAAEIPVRRNPNYWWAGDEGIKPDEAFDDGTFTYIRYRGQREFPAVYLERERGKESLVNTTIKGDTIVIQRVAGRYVLRKGNDVGSLVSPSFDEVGRPNETGTISPAVERDTKGDENPLPEVLPTQQTGGKLRASSSNQ